MWSYQGDQLELCVLDHGDGPGAHWARSVGKGDEVLLRKPEGTFVAAPAAPYHVFAGEETASVAFGAMLGALPAGARVYGAIEIASADDRLPLPRAAELSWRFRGNAAAASASLVTAVRDRAGYRPGPFRREPGGRWTVAARCARLARFPAASARC